MKERIGILCTIFFFLKMFFSNNCFILFNGRKLFLQPLLFIVGVLIVCIPYVCHSYFAYVVPLISIASCFITFMLVHGFFVPLWSSLCFPGKLYSFLCPLSIITKRGRKCGFWRFYMLGGAIHVVFIRGSYVLFA